MVPVVDKILKKINECIENETFKEVETDKIELKDLSTGDNWKELYKSVNAFLNTNGGIVIIGINEAKDKSKYTFRGFNPNNESKLKELPGLFTSDEGKPLDLSDFIRTDLFEIVDFRDGRVCIVPIEKLPDDKKYVLFEGNAYERKLTGDHKITRNEIETQKELRAELELARELRTVDDTSLEDLSIDKLNDYIQRLNQGMKVETLKADIPSALSFLERKKFVINAKPTLLGMLVCGMNIYDYVQGRCQVDGFVESPIDIAGNKKVFKDNVIPLLESSLGFVITNISTGISTAKGGSTTFEYPERLIRETVNNALAHRDYSVNKFVNITIAPGNHIEIRNPGKFRNEQILRSNDSIPIRRIIPIPKAQNPRLADVLKSFDRWEGKGWGMSSLTSLALENKVDIAYYVLYAEQDIGLFINKGRVLDEEAEWWLRSFGGYIYRKTNGRDLTEEQKTVLSYFYKSERLNRIEKYTIALTPDNNHFAVISQLEDWGLIYKHPNGPDLYPVYLVDRTLTKFDFIDDLRRIFGGAYDDLKLDYKDVLNVIYHFNEFSQINKDVNAAQVGDFLYFRKNQKILDVKHYNDYKRKVRNIINSLTNKMYLLKVDGRPNYKVNTNFKRTKSLFDQ
ncbi:helix-turn-helix domain-containing protein [Pseudoflavitalea rhizosphaerae]|uniref:AlbA family DNA-binding domain-containing protein n=1 Tax=Pseudoflavitalea rhizosphaerae TaxID=1884793 RepID=UPI000F8E5500|nr:RNA-binding domain-containing protein [Pseudoflavitalea rhizosphaerae]